MMIALPNPDGSFTCTVFAPAPMLDAIQTPAALFDLFERDFGDAVALIGRDRLEREFFNNPRGPLITVKCGPYHLSDKAVIIGDAAHAMVPFYGQGMNCGFEDVRVLFEHFQRHGVSATDARQLGAALAEYSTARHTDATAMCDLALANYTEMRASVISTKYLACRWIERVLHLVAPRTIVPLYTLVSFTNVPYSECMSRGRALRKTSETILKVVSAVSLVGGLVGTAWVAKRAGVRGPMAKNTDLERRLAEAEAELAKSCQGGTAERDPSATPTTKSARAAAPAEVAAVTTAVTSRSSGRSSLPLGWILDNPAQGAVLGSSVQDLLTGLDWTGMPALTSAWDGMDLDPAMPSPAVTTPLARAYPNADLAATTPLAAALYPNMQPAAVTPVAAQFDRLMVPSAVVEKAVSMSPVAPMFDGSMYLEPQPLPSQPLPQMQMQPAPSAASDLAVAMNDVTFLTTDAAMAVEPPTPVGTDAYPGLMATDPTLAMWMAMSGFVAPNDLHAPTPNAFASTLLPGSWAPTPAFSELAWATGACPGMK
ncbi:hypothetical protein AMAG_18463 [Allomyces macrogynus ATCC 38327]|uniref:FAD-binding domain-containing protein n=1 Tax=Allomyces macrogynus (strain ATCC 38327) TaxID=578462 RepID=A0A0L0SBX7_ALLM3|nr:hypothetical protein AMAG_18463 [Allomyces macrogynus ATCC 38327]|eukprot:KNE60053.1 hypothetical protein AMAG_18463 [Allomyces macrogynus ATCC 38327]